jgi:transposase-like protein
MGLRDYEGNAFKPKYCAQCRQFKPRIGGIDKLIMNGKRTRWMCEDCVKATARRAAAKKEAK